MDAKWWLCSVSVMRGVPHLNVIVVVPARLEFVYVTLLITPHQTHTLQSKCMGVLKGNRLLAKWVMLMGLWQILQPNAYLLCVCEENELTQWNGVHFFKS